MCRHCQTQELDMNSIMSCCVLRRRPRDRNVLLRVQAICLALSARQNDAVTCIVYEFPPAYRVWDRRVGILGFLQANSWLSQNADRSWLHTQDLPYVTTSMRSNAPHDVPIGLARTGLRVLPHAVSCGRAPFSESFAMSRIDFEWDAFLLQCWPRVVPHKRGRNCATS